MKKFLILLLVGLIVFSICDSVYATATQPKPEELDYAYREGYKLGEDDLKLKNPKKSEKELDAIIDVDYQSVSKNEILRKNFKDAYYKAYGAAIEGTAKDITNFGKNSGTEDGKNAANQDYLAEKPADAGAALPSSDIVIARYNLSRLSAEDQQEFYRAYQEGFNDSYVAQYLKLMQGESGTTNKSASAAGTSAGSADAKEQAIKDKEAGMSPNNSVRLSDYQILSKHYLTMANEDYKKSFLNAYKLAYMSEYNGAYYAHKTPTGDELIKKKYPEWYSKGEAAGSEEGTEKGTEDALNKKIMNWHSAYPSEFSTTVKYDLNKVGYSERNAFMTAFRKAFEEAYNKGFMDAMGADQNTVLKTKYPAWYSKGTSAGNKLGTEKGKADLLAKRSMNWQSAIPSDSELTDFHDLDKISYQEKEAFLAAYKEAFKSNYEKAYAGAMGTVGELKKSQGYEAGSLVGTQLGKKAATTDKMKNLPYDLERAKPDRDAIYKQYKLNLQDKTYADDFLDGVMESYATSYNETYKSLFGTETAEKITDETINIEGGGLQSADGRMAIEIPGGVYYDPVYVSIEALNSDYITSHGYVEGSKPYKINILNPNANYDNTRKIKLSFAFYGRPENAIGETDKGLPGNAFNAGLYKLEGNQWKYMDSKIVGSTVEVELNPQTITNQENIFALILDKSYVYLHDVRGHWAKDEINAMIRRGVINGYPDKTFRPDQPITRAEFLVLLSRHYNWNVESAYGYSNRFLDFAKFGFYKPYIDYGASMGYVIGYPDGEFKSYRNISYREIDWIMQRITGNKAFSWADYAKMIVNEKSVRSKSYDSMDNKITRGEFAYMVYMMDKWKY